jgi:tRNA(Ile)-lysidine synthase
MQRRHELDSKICHVERSACQAVALCEGWKHLWFFLTQMIRDLRCAQNDRKTIMKPLDISSRLSRDFPVDRRYLIGVSGGRDSVALLHWLVNLGYKKLIVCHLNHQLRGRSSLADARFVEKIALKYRAEFELESANVCALATKQKMSIETAAREARYKFFGETARRRKCKTIFLGHQADDLVETFLINLFRGMREIAKRRIDNVHLAIVRPFLGVWRKEIDIYVREHRIKFREDASNKNLNPLRNRIRHRIIPYLEKIFGRNIRPAIWRAAAIANEDEAWIDSQLPDLSDIELSVAKLRALPVALQRRAIFKWLRAQNISEVSFDVIERIRSVLEPAARVAKVNLAQDRHVRRRAGRIFIE